MAEPSEVWGEHTRRTSTAVPRGIRVTPTTPTLQGPRMAWRGQTMTSWQSAPREPTCPCALISRYLVGWLDFIGSVLADGYS